MNAELRPFKNGELNSESASTLNRDTTPLNRIWLQVEIKEKNREFVELRVRIP